MTRAITAATESPTALHSGRGSSPNRRSRLACSGDVILIQFRRETSNASYGICLKHTHTRQANHMSLFILVFYTRLSSPPSGAPQHPSGVRGVRQRGPRGLDPPAGGSSHALHHLEGAARRGFPVLRGRRRLAGTTTDFHSIYEIRRLILKCWLSKKTF